MNERDFVYWLRGFFEIGEKGGLPVDCLTPDQVREIKRHLEIVFAPAGKSSPKMICTCSGPNDACSSCSPFAFGPPTDLDNLHTTTISC